MDKNINNWTAAECFLFGAAIAGGRFFFAGEGGTGKRFEFIQSADGSYASAIQSNTESRPE